MEGMELEGKEAKKQADGQTDKQATFVPRSSRRPGVGACQLLAPLSPFDRASLQLGTTLIGTK